MIANSIGTFIPFLQDTGSMGNSIITASIVLSFMILPFILTFSEDAINSVPKKLKEGSLALGATRWLTIKKVILPEAKSGIISSIILGTGRAIGETMAVLMIMQFTTGIPNTLFANAGTMTSVIAAQLGSAFSQELTRQALFAVGLVLFIMIFILNIFIFIMKGNSKEANKRRKQKIKNFFSTSKTKNKTKKNVNNGKKFVVLEVISNSTINTQRKIDKTQKKFKKITHDWKQIPVKRLLLQEKIVKSFLILAVLITSAFLFTILGDIILRGGLTIQPAYFLETEAKGSLEGGFLNAIIGSLQLVGIALAFAAPLSIGAAIYVQEYAKRNNIFKRIVLFTSDTLASTPSIVFGAFGYIFFVYYLRFNVSLFAGGLTLGFMIIPIMLRSSIEAIKSIPQEYREGSLALGATKWETIRHVVLPPASPGISSGTILSIGRAIGETAAVMFAAGYLSHITTSIMEPVGNLPNLIWKNYKLSFVQPALADKVYAAAFTLLIVVLILNAISRLISYRSSRMMKE